MVSSYRVKDIKNYVLRELARHEIPPEEARVETDILVEHVFGLKTKDLILNPEIEISEKKLKEFNSLLKKRIDEKIPLQYLTNKAYFMGEEFYVDERVLIPRPETEILVEEVLRLFRSHPEALAEGSNSKEEQKDSSVARLPQNDRNFKIIDIGTGSGCIAIMLAKKLPEAKIFASDISEQALEVAKYNAEKLRVTDKIQFINSDIFDSLDKNEKFDVIVSNPPYIPLSQKESLQEEVQKHEPSFALFVEDEQGVSFYERLIEQSASRLDPLGFVALEIGIHQAENIKTISERNGFNVIKIVKDLSGIERVVVLKLQTF